MLNLDGAPLPLQAVVGIGIALSLGELGSIISSVSGGGAGTTSPAEIQNNPGQKDTPMMARAHPETEDGSGTATLGKKRKVSIREGDGNEGGGIEVEMSNKKPKVLIDGERLLEEFTCPISLGLPIDPVIAEDGRCYDRHHIDAYIRHHMRRAGGNGGANPRVTLRSPATNVSMGTQLTPVSQNTINTIQFLVDNGAVGDDVTAKRWSEAAGLWEVTRKIIGGSKHGLVFRSMGNVYRYGMFGLPTDSALAHEWFMKAAEMGDDSSVAQAGWNFVSGCGVGQDVARGIGMVHDAADMGESQAFYYLGMWHSEGVYGLERSRYLAKIYLKAHLSHHGSYSYSTAAARLSLLKHRICPVAKAIAAEKNPEDPKLPIEAIAAMVVKRAFADNGTVGHCRKCEVQQC